MNKIDFFYAYIIIMRSYMILIYHNTTNLNYINYTATRTITNKNKRYKILLVYDYTLLLKLRVISIH